MKKISAIIGALTISMASFAQQGISTDPTQGKGPFMGSFKKKSIATQQSAKVAGGVVQGRFDPGLSVLVYHGQATIAAGPDVNNIGTFVAPLFMDSTVKQSFQSGGTEYVTLNKLGMTFDPQSVIFDQFFVDPLFDKNDMYYLDTVWIAGVYNNAVHSNVTDTLLVEVVWGDTNNTNVYGRWGYVSPFDAWGRFVTPKFTNSTSHGDACYLSAASSNKMTFRHAITKADSAALDDNSYLPIVLNGATGVQLPANAVVSVMFTYIPGSAVAPGSVVYNGGGLGPDAQTENGFAGVCYQQITPPLSGGPGNYQDYFDDPGVGKNAGLNIYNDARYGQVPNSSIFNQVARAELVTSYWIDFSLHGTSTVGIKNYNSDLMSLGQNIPNPATKETTIRYSLKADAQNVKFSVTDLMGRVIYTEAIGSKSAGGYSVNVNTADYAAGVYYYSLEVDGAVSTKKMIINN